MKTKILIMLCVSAMVMGLTFTKNTGGNPETVESALGGANDNTYRAFSDTMSFDIWEHKYLTTQHEYADSTTYFLTSGDSVYGGTDNLPAAISYALNTRTYLIAHMALDSCHNGAAETTTTVPAAIALTAKYPAYKTFIDSLKNSVNDHLLQTISTRYYEIGDSLSKAFILHCAKVPVIGRTNYICDLAIKAYTAHCAKDTTDVSKVHFSPDATNTVAGIDSSSAAKSYASWILLKNGWNAHVADTDSIHNAYTGLDTLTSVDPTNAYQTCVIANEFITKFNQHVVRDTTGLDTLTAVHLKADTGLLTVAPITAAYPHWIADAVNNTAITFDSTNVATAIVTWNTIKAQYNAHIQLASHDLTVAHAQYTNEDSITAPDATNYATLYALANQAKVKYNQHAARYLSGTDSIHYLADTEGIVGTPDVTVGGGHIVADTDTLTAIGRTAYWLADYGELTVQVTSTGVTTGASVYIAGSLDNTNWFVEDSILFTADSTMFDHTSALYKYIKVYIDTWTDGTYNIEFYTGDN